MSVPAKKLYDAEFEHTDEPFVGPKALLYSVLIRGVLDARGGLVVNTSEGSADVIIKGARRWLKSERIECSPVRGITFRYICEHLEIDYRRVRKSVIADN